MPLVVRQASLEEFSIAARWARDEGWNPGLDDLPAFFAADPNGFFMGFLKGKPVSSISVVRYGSDYGFLGFYIVTPEHRGSGIGLATWKQGMAYLEGRTIGLDGVVDQQDNYRTSGFVYAGRNVRYSGIPKRPTETVEAKVADDSIVRSSPDLLPELIAYDRAFFPGERSAFLTAWTDPSADARRQTWVCVRDGGIKGYITVRKCAVGYKVGPLFADSMLVAEDLLTAAVSALEADAALIIDAPEANADAVRLAQEWGLQPVFETARMYRLGETGHPPQLPMNKTYGITTFELG